MTEIASHADECAESWVDPIGECIVVHDDSEVEDVTPEVDQEKAEQDKDLNTAITNLRSVLQNNAITNRIAIRRSSPFADYVAAREKKWFKPKGTLKVTFVGEPAVDDGGPKREFFSGMSPNWHLF